MVASSLSSSCGSQKQWHITLSAAIGGKIQVNKLDIYVRHTVLVCCAACSELAAALAGALSACRNVSISVRIRSMAAVSTLSLQWRLFSLDSLFINPESKPRSLCNLAYSFLTFSTRCLSRAFLERRRCSISDCLSAAVLFLLPRLRPRLHAPTTSISASGFS